MHAAVLTKAVPWAHACPRETGALGEAHCPRENQTPSQCDTPGRQRSAPGLALGRGRGQVLRDSWGRHLPGHNWDTGRHPGVRVLLCSLGRICPHHSGRPAGRGPHAPALPRATTRSPTLRHEEGDAEPALQHPLPQRWQVGPVERERAADEDVEQDAEALWTAAAAASVPAGRQPRPGAARPHIGSYPHVQLRAFVLLPLKDFRGCVGWAPAPRGQRLSRVVEVPKSKVCKAKKQMKEPSMKCRTGAGLQELRACRAPPAPTQPAYPPA